MKKQTLQGFTLLPLVMILLSLTLLLLTGLEQRRQWASRICQHQRCYLQALNQSISALAVAPYLEWQPATLQWQCRLVEQRQLCLKQRAAFPEMALLRVSSLYLAGTDAVTLYRFVRQNRGSEPADTVISPNRSTVSLFWVTGGWLDACPEKQPILCW